MDYTRLTQNGRYHGWIELDGKRETVDALRYARDRSWGVRPVGGARSASHGAGGQATVLLAVGADHLASASLFFHTNDDDAGQPWNRRAVFVEDGQPPHEIDDVSFA